MVLNLQWLFELPKFPLFGCVYMACSGPVALFFFFWLGFGGPGVVRRKYALLQVLARFKLIITLQVASVFLKKILCQVLVKNVI